MNEGGRTATGARTATRSGHVAAGGLELYAYYRVHVNVTGQALVAARECQRLLCAAHPGLVARLLTRSDVAEQHETWMETYWFEPDHRGPGVDASLQAAIEAAARALSRFITGQRHLEVFRPCA